MNCQIFETVVNDLAREQILEASAREQALAHSAECENCALRLALERRLSLGLRALAAQMKSVSAPPRVEERLREAFRTQAPLLVETRSVGRRRYWLGAAAAAIVIAFGIEGIRRSAPDAPPLTAIEEVNTEAKPSPQDHIVVTVQPGIEPNSRQNKASFLPARKREVRKGLQRSLSENEVVARGTAGQTSGHMNTTEADNSEQSEITTQFLPLSYLGPLGLQDGGQLVRVELPRSAMVSMGLPVNMERYGEKVKADVLVSADGLARAIRFVQ